MKFADARKLHNGDHVMIKETKEVVNVVSALVEEKTVQVQVVSPSEGFSTLNHN